MNVTANVPRPMHLKIGNQVVSDIEDSWNVNAYSEVEWVANKVDDRAVPEFGSGSGRNPAFFCKSGW